MEIHAHEDGELIRIAWHLGNRHLPVQLLDDRIRIRADHVIAEMVEGLGGHVDPDPGAVRPGSRRLCRAAATTISMTTMTSTTDRRPLLNLLAWLSPAFPTGAFAYSHGLEWAVEVGDIKDGDSLRHWLADVLADGAGRSDTILLRHAHRAAADPVALREIAYSCDGLRTGPRTA